MYMGIQKLKAFIGQNKGNVVNLNGQEYEIINICNNLTFVQMKID